LQIAEDNGGREARSRVENSCWIDAVLSPYERNKGWNVFYYDNERHKILEIIIDDTTGENQIIWPLTQ
jgi:hypothetical protein